MERHTNTCKMTFLPSSSYNLPMRLRGKKRNFFETHCEKDLIQIFATLSLLCPCSCDFRSALNKTTEDIRPKILHERPINPRLDEPVLSRCRAALSHNFSTMEIRWSWPPRASSIGRLRPSRTSRKSFNDCRLTFSSQAPSVERRGRSWPICCGWTALKASVFGKATGSLGGGRIKLHDVVVQWNEAIYHKKLLFSYYSYNSMVVCNWSVDGAPAIVCEEKKALKLDWPGETPTALQNVLLLLQCSTRERNIGRSPSSLQRSSLEPSHRCKRGPTWRPITTYSCRKGFCTFQNYGDLQWFH